jgi:hypothetical protein
MMSRNTDGAVMVVRSVRMVMRQCYERGKKENQYEEYGNLAAPVHDVFSKSTLKD